MKKFVNLIIPVTAVLVSSILLLTTADSKMADFFQRPLKSTEESAAVMMINVDDAAVEEIGSWPFSRDVYADVLVTLKELNVSNVIFDLSFLDKSPSKVDEDYVQSKLPEYIRQSFEQLKNGNMSAAQAENSILLNVNHVARNLDSILAGGLKFAGDPTLAITMVNFGELTEEDKQILEENSVLKDVIIEKDTITPEFQSVMPAISELMKSTKNTGFVNADVDKDGYLRRIHLVAKSEGKYYGQLVFKTILKYYGNPKVVISNAKITLKDAVIEFDEEGNAVKKQDIIIPRSRDGSVLIKYPKNIYDKYNQISLWPIYRITKLEETLKQAVNTMSQAGFFSLVENNPVDIWEAVDWLRNELYNGEDAENDITIASYLEYKEALIQAIEECLSDQNLQNLCASVENAPDAANVKAYINDSFTEYRKIFDEYINSRKKLAEKVAGANCIIGTTATSTSDWGINQYEDHYPNPGVHYSLANQLISRDFVDDCPLWISILAALIICLTYSFVANKIKGTGRQIFCGVFATVLSFTLILVFFLVTRIYIGAVVPVTSVLITFIVTTVIGFLSASKDKKFITNAFSQCLSKEVVNEIVANPSSFKLGGQRLEMTAIFTDIQKFSGFSELLSASQLVALLNYYLTKMSDIIMEERGTVDKYEGDAIIALVGAPVKMTDHGERAVAASLKMKAAEIQMNREIKEIASIEKPVEMDQDLYDAFKIMVENNRTIFTRIGLNSGEMIAGYMGSENKKNYTMMGNNVNLASRLEGVNKQYSTGGILMSEATRNLLGDRFVVRRLDKVRVVNVNTPIRLYEPLCELSGADEKILKYVEAWEKTIDLFESAQYDKALECFRKLSEARPSDKTAKYYINLLENFFCKGKYPVEADGVGVEFMPEDSVFKLLQK